MQSSLDTAAFHRLVDTIYESVLDLTQMPAALAMLSAYAGANSADYVVWDKRTRAPHGWCSHDAQPGDCPECIRDQDWVRGDALASTGSRAACEGNAGPIVSTTFVSLTLMDTPDLHVVMRLCARDDACDMSATQRQQRLERVVPHLRRAARMQQCSQALNESAALCTAGLDALDFGVMVIAGGMRVKYANAWSRALISANDCLSLDGGRFHAADWGCDVALRTLVEQSLGRRGVHPAAGSWMYRAPGGRAVPFIAAPLVLTGALYSTWASPQALVLIGNTETRSVMDMSVLAALFGLTRTECRIAVRLAAGETLKEIAQYQWLSLHTVRIHTREILRKTGTHRQSELMRLLHLLPNVDLKYAGAAAPLPDLRNRLNP